MNRKPLHVGILGLAMLIAGCGNPVPDRALAPGSNTPFLGLDAEGRVLLSWTEPTADGHTLRLAVWDGRGWDETRTIAQGRDWFINWADFPSVVGLSNGDLVAHWLQREGPDTYAYGIRTARSRDGGLSWSEPLTPHRDGTLTEHGFVTLYPAGAGAAGIVWLDGRQMTQAGGAMSLRAARLEPDGRITAEAVLDARTCDCCQTAAARTGKGTVVVYRDRSADEVRDISAVYETDGNWSAPGPVADDSWHIAACPVNGPALVNTGPGILSAWFTGAGNEPRVHVAWLHGDATFGDSLRVDLGQPLGRVGLAASGAGDGVVSWLENTDAGTVIMLRRVRRDGSLSPPIQVARTDSGRASGFPRIITHAGRVLVAWTDVGASPGRVRLDSVPVPE